MRTLFTLLLALSLHATLGAQVTQQFFQQGVPFISLAFNGPDTGLVIASDGRLLRTFNGGNTWVLDTIETGEGNPNFRQITIGTGGLAVARTNSNQLWFSFDYFQTFNNFLIYTDTVTTSFFVPPNPPVITEEEYTVAFGAIKLIGDTLVALALPAFDFGGGQFASQPRRHHPLGLLKVHMNRATQMLSSDGGPADPALVYAIDANDPTPTPVETINGLEFPFPNTLQDAVIEDGNTISLIYQSLQNDLFRTTTGINGFVRYQNGYATTRQFLASSNGGLLAASTSDPTCTGAGCDTLYAGNTGTTTKLPFATSTNFTDLDAQPAFIVGCGRYEVPSNVWTSSIVADTNGTAAGGLLEYVFPSGNLNTFEYAAYVTVVNNQLAFTAGSNGYVHRIDKAGLVNTPASSTPELANALALRAYPNPTNSTLSVELPTAAPATHTVLDVQGRTVLTHSSNTGFTTLPTESLAPGVYVLHTVQNGQHAVLRFVRN